VKPTLSSKPRLNRVVGVWNIMNELRNGHTARRQTPGMACDCNLPLVQSCMTCVARYSTPDTAQNWQSHGNQTNMQISQIRIFYLFQPIAFENSSAINVSAISLISDVRRKISLNQMIHANKCFCFSAFMLLLSPLTLFFCNRVS